MQTLRNILGEVAGLFMEDRSLMVALAVWLLLGGVLLQALHPGRAGGPILAGGVLAIVAENVLRAGRRTP